jgi:HlyD family secretion protein
MNRKPLLRALAVAALLAGIGGGAAWWFSARGDGGVAETLTGYVEGEALYFAAPSSGAVARLHVERGARVEAGAPLFGIDRAAAEAQRQQAEAALAAAERRVEDARKGQRPEELAVLAAQRAAAAAALEEARAEYGRVRVLASSGVYARARLDQAEATFDAAKARHEETVRQLDVAKLGSRRDQVAAAEAEAARARAALEEAEVRLAQLAPTAPAAGLVEDVFFRPGEWVPANQPVLSLLPDDRVKVRFFVPEEQVALYRPGLVVTLNCDGCGPPRRARVAYVSPRAEFTPPVIYSRGSREKLVFMVEAVPERPAGLAPGQPVDVSPPAPAPER